MITVNAQALVSMLDLYRASNDVRENVRGVVIEPHGTKPGAVLVRTDGHSLAIRHDESATVDRPILLLKDAKLMSHLRRWAKNPENRVVIEPSKGTIGLHDTTGTAPSTVNMISAPQSLRSAKDALLAWRELFASPVTTTTVSDEFAYQADFITRAQKLVGGSAINCVQVNRHQQPVLVIGAKDSPAVALLMPAKAEITRSQNGHVLGSHAGITPDQNAVAAVQRSINAICGL